MKILVCILLLIFSRDFCSSSVVRRDTQRFVARNFSIPDQSETRTKADPKTSFKELVANIQKMIDGAIKFLEKLAEEKRKAGTAIFGAAEKVIDSGVLERVLASKASLFQTVAKHGPEVGSAVVSAVQVGPTRVVVVFKVSNVTGAVVSSTDMVKLFICSTLCPKNNSSTDKETNDACRQLNECDGPNPQQQRPQQQPQQQPQQTTQTPTSPKQSKNETSTFNPFPDDYGDYVQE